MIFETKNSTYQVNIEKKLIRRLRGKQPAANNFPDGEWKKVDAILNLNIGSQASILWGQTKNGKSQIRQMLTSRIIKIIDEQIN